MDGQGTERRADIEHGDGIHERELTPFRPGDGADRGARRPRDGNEVTPWEFLKHYTTVSTTVAALMFGFFAWLGLDRLSTIESTVHDAVESQASVLLDKEIKARHERIEQEIAGFEKTSSGLKAEVEAKLEPFRYLAQKGDDPEDFANVGTIGVAVTRISKLLAEEREGVALRLAQEVVRDKLPGSAVDFHNLSAVLARADQVKLAFEVSEQGMRGHPNNSDLLADALKYATDLGQYDRAGYWYDVLVTLDKSRWNWRCFDFAADYLIGSGRDEEVFEVYRAFQEQIPQDERGYSGLGLFWMGRDRYDKAIEAFERGRSRCPRAPQCAAALADLYTYSGEYEKAVAAADNALEVNMGEQPTTSTSAVLFRRAQALDAWVLREIREETAEDGTLDPRTFARIVPRLRQCLSDYATVVRMKPPVIDMTLQCLERTSILSQIPGRFGLQEDEGGAIQVEPGPSPGVPPARSLAALASGDLEPYREFMADTYYEEDVWKDEVLARFPDFDLEDECEQLGVSSNDVPVFLQQDVLAQWVDRNHDRLTWDAGPSVYRLAD